MRMNKNDTVAVSIHKNYPGAELIGDFCAVKEVVHHSKDAKQGALFVCLSGFNHDGHDFVNEAYEKGCRHFLCEREICVPADASVAKVHSVRMHLFDFLSDFFGFCSADFKCIAVTGTKGKTTTALMLHHILNKKGYRAACSSTVGIFGEEWLHDTENTTPDIFVLARWLGKMKRAEIRYVIVEVSSAALSGGRIYGMHFDIGILTSFSRDHIGKGEHKNMAEYLCAKKSLFSLYGIKNAILPEGIYRGEFIVSDSENRIAIKTDAQVVSEVEEGLNEQKFKYREKEIRLSIAGAHNRTNARLALAAASLATGEREEAFFSCLSNFSVSGRFEQLLHKGVIVVIDYAHNRESFQAVATSVSKISSGKKICVFGSVGGRGENRRLDLAHTACEIMDFSIITEDDSGKEDPLHICAQIYAAFPDKTRARIVTDRVQAIRYAFSLCREGDALLLLGKGHERVMKRREENLQFSERDIVSSL